MRQKKKDQLKREAKKFSFVGIIATTIDYTILNLLTFVGHFPLLAANIFSATGSSLVSYKLNKRLVFEGRRHGRKRTVLLYALILAAGIYVIQSTVLLLISTRLDPVAAPAARFISGIIGTDLSVRAVSVNLAKLCAGIVSAIWNYLMLRHFVFVPETQRHEVETAE